MRREGILHLVSVIEDVIRAKGILNRRIGEAADSFQAVFDELGLESHLFLVFQILPGTPAAEPEMRTGGLRPQVTGADPGLGTQRSWQKHHHGSNHRHY